RHAVVAIEDERYYTRGCLDTRALLRAVLFFGKSGGASTLTRQLARNALGLQRQNVISRKLKELILGCQLESKYSKEDLLDMYLNWIPFGPAYGVEEASKRFFGKSAKDLTLAESAVLAALPQSPTYYNPYGKHVRTTVTPNVVEDIVSGKIKTSDDIADEDFQLGLLGANVGTGKSLVYIGGRTDQVLRNMRLQKYITEEEETKALAELQKITFKKYREDIRAPHFVLWVREQVEELLGGSEEKNILEQGGLTIETTLNWDLQQEAEKAVAKYADTAAKVYEANNIALVSLDPKTREILAYVGNTDYADEDNDGKVDMAQAPRQPGSSFKPFSYAAA
ncbi:transglycosylase domain-containing protein, partial [Candidatus Peregrinibacteria bacterium]|nr:transglycosylase domain-containing protein [Candidatus Peregrinibacteria bacterium]